MSKRLIKTAVYAGSYDPITKGHLDIIKRTVNMFDKLIIGTGVNAEKKCCFDCSTKELLIKESLIELLKSGELSDKNYKKIKVQHFKFTNHAI